MAHGILPTSNVAPFTLSKLGMKLFATGGSLDVWRFAREKHGDQVFVARSFRVYERDSVERICKVVIVRPRGRSLGTGGYNAPVTPILPSPGCS